MDLITKDVIKEFNRDKFNKIIGLLDSPNENEATNAFKIASAMLRAAGMTWKDEIKGRAAAPGVFEGLGFEDSIRRQRTAAAAQAQRSFEDMLHRCVQQRGRWQF